MLNPWAIVVALVTLGGALTGTYIKGRGDGADSVIARQARDDQVRMETLQLAQQGAAEAIAAIEIKHVTVRQKLETQLVEKPVYRECSADDRVWSLTNEAITGQPAGDRSVSGAGGNDRPDFW